MKKQLIENLNLFINGKNQSNKIAREIESQLLSEYPDDDFIEDVTDMLAQYQQGGGDFLFSEDEVTTKFIALKRYLLNK